MNVLDFIASLASSLAWPALLLFFFVKFRGPLSKVILSLARFKYKDLEFEFKRDLEAIEIQRQALPESSPERISEKDHDDSDKKLREKILAVANISPEAAISLAWNEVESALRSAVMRTAISADSPSENTALKNVMLLNDQGYIIPLEVDILNKMRDMRNLIAHARAPESLSTRTAIEYAEEALRAVKYLQSIQRKSA